MKAILVIDIPDDIWENREEYLGMYAEAWSWKIDDGWCCEYYTDSLRPMPEKKRENDIIYEPFTNSEYNMGYNDCIDEILGGK